MGSTERHGLPTCRTKRSAKWRATAVDRAVLNAMSWPTRDVLASSVALALESSKPYTRRIAPRKQGLTRRPTWRAGWRW